MAPGKYYDIELFHPEPPEDRKAIKALFHGRGDQLATALGILKQHFDIKGKRFGNRPKRPWIIHGESRSGKSHLARKLMTELPVGKRRFQIIVKNRDELIARRVMSKLYMDLRGYFIERTTDENLDADLASHPLINDTRDFVDQITPYIGGSAEQVTIKVRADKTKGTKWEARFGMPKLFQLSGGFNSQTTTGDEQTVVLRNPDADDIAIHCAIMVDTLTRLKLCDHILVLFDDVDLLETYHSPDRNGRLERALLTGAMLSLVDTPGLDLIVTARSWYSHSQSKFHELLNLDKGPAMTTADLVAIHDKQFDFYAPKQAKGFLQDETLRELALKSDGQPGIFLQDLYTLFKKHQGSNGQLRSMEWVEKAFVDDYHLLGSKYLEASQVLEKMSQSDSLQTSVTERNIFQGTPFEFEWVNPSYHGEDIYFMSRLRAGAISRFLRESKDKSDE